MHKFISVIFFLIPLAWTKALNAHYYSTKLFLLYFISSFCLLALPKKFFTPKLPKPLMIGFLGLIFLHILFPALTLDWVNFLYIAKFLSFIMLTLYFTASDYTLEKTYQRTTYAIAVVASAILSITFYDFYKQRIASFSYDPSPLIGSMGNVNMLIEFLILTLPFIFYWTRHKDSISRGFKLALMSGWFFFILYCHSRSAWIGLGAWGLWQIKKGLDKKEWMAVAAAFILYYTAILLPAGTAPASDWKQGSGSTRMSLYKSTAGLIADEPLGVGSHGYASQIIPYLMKTDILPMEYVVADQPHSELLKWTAQYGVLGGLLSLFVIIFIFYILVRNKLYFKTDSSDLNKIFLLDSFIVFIPQILFQFPFENPASILYLAFTLGLFLSNFPKNKEIYISKQKKIILGFAATLGIIHSFAFFGSVYLESNDKLSTKSMEIACDIYPTRTGACFSKMFNQFRDGKFDKLKIDFKKDILRQPLDSNYLRGLPSYLKITKGEKASCEAVHIYNLIFKNQMFFDEPILKGCAQYGLPIPNTSSKQFKSDYMAWLSQALEN